jgi:hypothetical protein
MAQVPHIAGMITLRHQLIAVADGFAAHRGLSRARVSTLVFNSGTALNRIAAGRDLNTKRWERAMLWFSRNWPEGAEWPAGVARPAPACSPEAA